MATDDRILEAALRVAEVEGLRGATTRRIAEEAGVNEVTIFRRFGSKDQLLCEAFRRNTNLPEPLLPTHPVDPERELTAWCERHAANLYRARLLIRSAWTEQGSHPAVCRAAQDAPRRIAAELEAYLEALRERGLARGDWCARAATRMLMGALFGEIVADPTMDDPNRELHPEEIAARYVPLLLRAIGAEGRGPAR